MCWLNDNASAVQAICSVFGIVGLGFYCWLTYGIRKASVAQQKAAQAPMIMFSFDKDEKYWMIKNYGVGPATKVWWKPGERNDKSPDWYDLGAIAPGDFSDLPHHGRPEESHLIDMCAGGARIHYSDMADNHYATWGIWKDDAFNQEWGAIGRNSRLGTC